MIRDDGERTLLFDLDVAIQRLNKIAGIIRPRSSSRTCTTTLLRRWADM